MVQTDRQTHTHSGPLTSVCRTSSAEEFAVKRRSRTAAEEVDGWVSAGRLDEQMGGK